MKRKELGDAQPEQTLGRAGDAATLSLRERLFGSLRRAGALAPDALAAGKALGDVTGVGHLGLLPTLLSGFFGVCSPAGARAAEAQLLILAQELAAVPAPTRSSYFAREGALQLLRDFIGEAARAESDQASAHLRRVLVTGARTQAPLTAVRRLFALATRLSTGEIGLLCALVEAEDRAADADGRASAAGLALREGVALERASAASDLALSLERLVHEGLARVLPGVHVDPRHGQHVATELGRQLWSWLRDAPQHQLPSGALRADE